MSDADDIIKRLGLAPHPEGGFYRETFRDVREDGARAHSTAIYYLLREGEISRWHRVDAAEIWHFYSGAPLELFIAETIALPTRYVLGSDIARGETPQIIVPKNIWQSARSLGAFTLVGCTVAPGFEFSGFEFAS